MDFGIRKFRGAISLVLMVGLGIGIVSAVSPRWVNWLSVQAAGAQDDDEAFDLETLKAAELMRIGEHETALKSFKRANDMRGKKCARCLYGMAQAYLGLEAYKSVVETSDKVIELAGSDKKLLLQAHNVKGVALQAQAEGKNEKKLMEAEAVLRQGLALDKDDEVPKLHFNLGYVLMQLNRDADGVAEMKKYVELEGTNVDSERATKMIENPRRAREPYAPDFSITTSEGEHITLEDLRGKVVVLDFWGTWCPPCVESVPSLRSLHKKFAKEPSFVLIGISSDSDKQEWKAFTEKEKMIWPQFLDSNHEVQMAFGVRAFPTYIVIDHEGIIRFRSIGTSWERSGNLNDAIKKQVKLVAKTDAAN